MDHICSLAKNQGFKKIYISTDQKGLYENFGFSFLKILKEVNGYDSLVYQKELT